MSLHDAFEELRRNDLARTPSFERVWRNAHGGLRARRSTFVFALAACALVVVVATSLVMMLRAPREVPREFLAASVWKGPTDFLLDTPGRELVRSVPQIPERKLK